jgi:hypothetical protein
MLLWIAMQDLLLRIVYHDDIDDPPATPSTATANCKTIVKKASERSVSMERTPLPRVGSALPQPDWVQVQQAHKRYEKTCFNSAHSTRPN